MQKLLAIKERLLNNGSVSGKMRVVVESLGKSPKRPLGKVNPWTWWPELVRGCNLACVFCPARMIEKSDWKFMSEETFDSVISLLSELTPYGRMNFAMLGEPTLHPKILDFVRNTRERAPHVQITTYTNGKKLIDGSITYKQLFDAGINCVFTDMYAPWETHKKLAEDSGYEYYHESEKPESIVNVFEYRDEPNRHTIRLSETPYSWSKRKMGRGEFHTFLNTLDWKAAELFDITPTIDPPHRRCDQPSKYVNVNWDGSYQVCCAAAMSQYATDKLGNVSGGVEAFMSFWLGEYMQDVRLKVDHKDRAAHELCSKCSYVTIRADIPIWKAGMEQYWDGAKWSEVPEYVPSNSATGALKKMRRTPSSRERQVVKNPIKIDVSVDQLKGENTMETSKSETEKKYYSWQAPPDLPERDGLLDFRLVANVPSVVFALEDGQEISLPFFLVKGGLRRTLDEIRKRPDANLYAAIIKKSNIPLPESENTAAEFYPIVEALAKLWWYELVSIHGATDENNEPLPISTPDELVADTGRIYRSYLDQITPKTKQTPEKKPARATKNEKVVTESKPTRAPKHDKSVTESKTPKASRRGKNLTFGVTEPRQGITGLSGVALKKRQQVYAAAVAVSAAREDKSATEAALVAEARVQGYATTYRSYDYAVRWEALQLIKSGHLYVVGEQGEIPGTPKPLPKA